MESEHSEASFILKSISETLSLMVSNDGEDISCYSALALDEHIISLIRARALMTVVDSRTHNQQIQPTGKTARLI